MGDIAVYAKGSARPTGGAGAVALLIGPNSPLTFDRGLRSNHIAHAYDFYKPVMDSEYPIVDGQLSVICYLNALDKCYNQYKKKYQLLSQNFQLDDINNNNSIEDTDPTSDNRHSFNLNMASAFLFHSPYCKLVQKSFARLLWNDFLESNSVTPNSMNKDENELAEIFKESEKSNLGRFKQLSKEDTYTNKELEKEVVRLSNSLFKKKTEPSLFLAKEIGNMYTPSLYGCLASHLISKSIEELKNTRLCLFSYGSGLVSSMFSLTISENANQRFTLENIITNLNDKRTRIIENRIEIDPSLYDKFLKKNESIHNQSSRSSNISPSSLYPGTWYLTSIDEKYRRSYERVLANSQSKFDSNKSQEYLAEELSKIELINS